ncbi:unnamed protein product, partial [Scytosiphon promiscuus]
GPLVSPRSSGTLKSWYTNGPTLLKENLRKSRKLLRFGRRRATQSTLAKIGDTYTAKKEEPCRLMLFGRASFAATKGRASAPRKVMIREMETRGVVLTVREHHTSKKCPGCFEDTVEDKERRMRSCRNVQVGYPEEACRLHPLTREFDMDRDHVGSTNIEMSG